MEPKFIFKDDAQNNMHPIEDFWYDLFEGGYIKPKLILADADQLAKVEEAVKTLRNLKGQMDDAELTEYM